MILFYFFKGSEEVDKDRTRHIIFPEKRTVNKIMNKRKEKKIQGESR